MGQVAKLKKTCNLAPVIQNIQGITENIALAYIYLLPKFGDFMSCGSNDILKNAPCLMYYHRDVTDLVNHEMVKNAKT